MGEKHKAVAGQITTATGPWTETVLVCRKCSKKLKGGFGPDGRDNLAGMLKEVLRNRGQRRHVRVIQVGCLDLCPRGGVVVMRGDTPGDMLIVPQGLETPVLVDRLLGPALTPGLAAGS